MGDYIDDMIEGWAKGLKEAVRPTAEGSLDLPGTKAKAKARKRVPKEKAVETMRAKPLPDPPTNPGEPHRVIPEITEDWNPPRILPCGHTQWADRSGDVNSEAQREARDLGYCCDAERRMNDRASKHKDVHGSAKRVSPFVHWHVKGLYAPVPEGLRRTPDREAKGGWPGLDVDPETGLLRKP